MNAAVIKDNALLDGVLGQALDLINSSNIMVLICYKYIFKYFYRSIGGYITITIIIFIIISVLIYFLVGLPKLKVYILSLTEKYLSFLKKKNINKGDFPPRKRSLKNDAIENKMMNKSNKKVKINPSTIQKEGKIDKSKIQHFMTNNEDKNKKKKNPTKNKLLTSTKIKLIPSNDITIALKDKNEIKSNKSKLMLLEGKKPKDKKELIDTEKLSKTNSNDKPFFEAYLSTYPDDMEFDDALVKDNRKFRECFVENLKEKQMIAFTFFADDPIKIKIMKIILLILNINLYFVINGLFYSEEFITELYEINDDENFFSYIPRSIDKLIYTTLVSIIIGYIVELFFVDEKKIKGIFKREKNNAYILNEEIVKFINSMQKMYLAFIIFVSIILLISSYYLLCFNYVYPKTQIEWIKCSITIMIVMQIISFLKCLVITGLRYLSFKIKSQKMYKVSKLLD